MVKFENRFSFEERLKTSKGLLEKYPNRIPVICEAGSSSLKISNGDNSKYLIPNDKTLGQFLIVLRKKLNLKSDEAIYVFVNNILPPTSSLMEEIYEKYKSKDGFLYLTYAQESTFG